MALQFAQFSELIDTFYEKIDLRKISSLPRWCVCLISIFFPLGVIFTWILSKMDYFNSFIDKEKVSSSPFSFLQIENGETIGIIHKIISAKCINVEKKYKSIKDILHFEGARRFEEWVKEMSKVPSLLLDGLTENDKSLVVNCIETKDYHNQNLNKLTVRNSNNWFQAYNDWIERTNYSQLGQLEWIFYEANILLTDPPKTKNVEKLIEELIQRFQKFKKAHYVGYLKYSPSKIFDCEEVSENISSQGAKTVVSVEEETQKETENNERSNPKQLKHTASNAIYTENYSHKSYKSKEKFDRAKQAAYLPGRNEALKNNRQIIDIAQKNKPQVQKSSTKAISNYLKKVKQNSSHEHQDSKPPPISLPEQKLIPDEGTILISKPSSIANLRNFVDNTNERITEEFFKTYKPVQPPPIPLPEKEPLPDFPKLSQKEETATMSIFSQSTKTIRCVDKNTYNILLLGETGVGKTTFFNSCANYLLYKTEAEAMQNPIFLSNVSFSITEGVQSKKVVVRQNYGDCIEAEMNEDAEIEGASQTQRTFLSSIPFEEEGIFKNLRILDTPGLNDTRGAGQDVLNMKNILETANEIGEFHAICILLKPDMSKMTINFRRSLDNLLGQLHKDAVKNLIFCFTKTCAPSFLPGDGLKLLRTYLEELPGIDIPVNKQNIFCFDNESFRFMCTKQCYPDYEIPAWYHSQGWNHSKAEMDRLLERIKTIPPYSIERSQVLEYSKQVLSQLAPPVAKALHKKIQFRAEVQYKAETGHIKQENEMNARIKNKDLSSVKSNMPVTICKTARCQSSYTGKPGICHEMCEIDIRKEQKLSDCELFEVSDFCRICSCHINYHTQIFVDANIDDKYDAEPRKNSLIQNTNEMNELLDQQDGMDKSFTDILSICSQISSYMRNHSIAISTDPFYEYFNELCRIEEDKARLTGKSSYYLEDLKKVLEKYEHLKTTYDCPDYSQQEIGQHVRKLCEIDHYGAIFKEHFRIYQ